MLTPTDATAGLMRSQLMQSLGQAADSAKSAQRAFDLTQTIHRLNPTWATRNFMARDDLGTAVGSLETASDAVRDAADQLGVTLLPANTLAALDQATEGMRHFASGAATETPPTKETLASWVKVIVAAKRDAEQMPEPHVAAPDVPHGPGPDGAARDVPASDGTTTLGGIADEASLPAPGTSATVRVEAPARADTSATSVSA
jgi:hypothetical protein